MPALRLGPRMGDAEPGGDVRVRLRDLIPFERESALRVGARAKEAGGLAQVPAAPEVELRDEMIDVPALEVVQSFAVVRLQHCLFFDLR